MKIKPCKHCGGENHLSWRCFNNPRRKEQMAKKKANGKISLQWSKTRREWFKVNHSESYNCHYCGRFLLKEDVELDHYHSRSRRPDLRFELSNLVPSCHDCNTDKGSMSGDEYPRKVGKC